ncbi:hypothetical protein BGW36DRAFT_358379 [Talaromyces proteolyticus]|uniref:Uncharacterized protein n=1 Tax=Talaromyces proteolyticus TaxID=1131652 RepID=A0AAD4Q1U2_9EURO|nr:uncharacterized protein BGW36DRAFT_358379 [Talaromyces proteolyticus]KAH8698865.1 hypothetical protein BGW36DRAFT_358379 [Talaromyces proteolyticus]
MSLLLGRASYLQDFDIDVLHPAPSSDPAIWPSGLPGVWVFNSRLCKLVRLPFYLGSKLAVFSTHKFSVLLYSSFTPFIVVFLHAIAKTNLEDVHLLDNILATLKHTRNMSPACDRLYKICNSFATVSRDLVSGRSSSSAVHAERGATLEISHDPQHTPIFHLESMEESWGMGVPSTEADAHETMSALLESWENGQPFANILLEESLCPNMS